MQLLLHYRLPGGHSEWEPPDPIPNSEVKTLSADDSVGSPHVKVGHCQDLYIKNPTLHLWGFFCLIIFCFLSLAENTVVKGIYADFIYCIYDHAMS